MISAEDNKCYAATPRGTLIEQLMDANQPKTEREWAAKREIEALQAQLERHATLVYELQEERCTLQARVAELEAKLSHEAEHVRRLLGERGSACNLLETTERRCGILAAELVAIKSQEPCAVFLGWNEDGSANLDAACEGPETLGENDCLYLAAGAEPTPPVQEPLSDNAILGIYNKVGQEDGAPYRFAGAIEAITKEIGA